MGTYVNPGNEGFANIVRDEYVDKTGLIALVNDVINTPRKMVAVTRPRRFGKSFAAQSLVAYYCCSCDSCELFKDLEVSRSAGYEKHLNAYNVIRLDMTEFTSEFGADVVPHVKERIAAELQKEFPDVEPEGWLTASLLSVVEATNRKFVFVIDEWDAVFREAKRDTDAQEKWVKFLRLLFKNASFTDKAVAAAYITGILPIKRYGTESALTDFWEYTMLDPADYAPYVGFTGQEVEGLAGKHGMNLDDLRRWYDGYLVPAQTNANSRSANTCAYAPYSVIQACKRHRIGPYWTSSESFEALRINIDLNLDGLQSAIVQLLGGSEVSVDVAMFENDMTTIRSKDDALTLLIHLGYLTYNADLQKARVPNEEVNAELKRAVSQSTHAEIAEIVRESDALLRATWDMDAGAVAAGIAHAHDYGCAPLFYNDEQALRAVVKAAYICAADYYATIEELPSGRGCADLVYLPKHGVNAPALVVELKWDKTADAALAQILQRDYPDVLRSWGGELLLVGIAYDSKTKKHACTITRMAGA